MFLVQITSVKTAIIGYISTIFIFFDAVVSFLAYKLYPSAGFPGSAALINTPVT